MTPPTDSEDRSLAWLLLHAARGLDSATRQALLEKWGDPSAVYAARDQWRDAAPGVQFPDPRELEETLAWLEGPDNHLVCQTDPDYPTLLQQIPGAPLLLF
ncbi:MAG: hypothetical protein LJE84_05040, partial [Gammaproteobacteria bacterium]|nr:hypothetical protein [Gammaproteobacteria bacterium]